MAKGLTIQGILSFFGLADEEDKYYDSDDYYDDDYDQEYDSDLDSDTGDYYDSSSDCTYSTETEEETKEDGETDGIPKAEDKKLKKCLPAKRAIVPKRAIVKKSADNNDIMSGFVKDVFDGFLKILGDTQDGVVIEEVKTDDELLDAPVKNAKWQIHSKSNTPKVIDGIDTTDGIKSKPEIIEPVTQPVTQPVIRDETDGKPEIEDYEYEYEYE